MPHHDADHLFTEGCPDCEATRGLLGLSHHLRLLSVDLWVAGWTPDELIDHVRAAVVDRRAADLVAHCVVVDDAHRSDQARPPAWIAAVDQIRARLGLGPDDLGLGWVAVWIRSNSTPHTAVSTAELIHRVIDVLED
ncbi:MAG: hypothetical protein AAGG08_09585, partial [Actinomycetota bacterium]